MPLHKKQYNALVQVVNDFSKGLDDIEFGTTDWSHQQAREEVRALLIARLAWFCAQDNPNFDSFRFVDAMKGTR